MKKRKSTHAQGQPPRPPPAKRQKLERGLLLGQLDNGTDTADVCLICPNDKEVSIDLLMCDLTMLREYLRSTFSFAAAQYYTLITQSPLAGLVSTLSCEFVFLCFFLLFGFNLILHAGVFVNYSALQRDDV
jgi:hypothetical protein